MTAQTWVSIVLAAIALAALYFSRLSATNATQQTKLQTEQRQAAAQPYLWADLRPDEAQAELLMLVVGNSGPTVATDVRVTFDPRPVISLPGREQSTLLEDLEKKGIASLPPGRRMEYSLAVVHEAVSEAVAQQIVYRVTITGYGPFGEIPVLSYNVDLADLGPTRAVGEGSLRLVSKSIDELAKALKK